MKSAHRTLPVLLATALLLSWLPASPASAGSTRNAHGKSTKAAHKRARKHRKQRKQRRATYLATKAQMTAVTLSPANGQTVAGPITWQVSVSGAAATRVDFALDGTVKWSQRTAPYLYGGAANGLDTRTMANGSHTLTATAFGPKGVKAVTKVVVGVSNQAPQVPAPAPAPAPAPEPEPAPEPAPAPAPAPAAQVYWGATIGSQLTGMQAPWDMGSVSKFEEMTQKKLSLVQFFQPFSNCNVSPCTFYGFPSAMLENIRKHGSIPVLSWASQSIPGSLTQADYQLSDVISGRYDSSIRTFATAAKNWGHPFFLRFNWEMNGKWFSWSEGVNGNRSGEYVAAWRHVHEIFDEVGASNVNWVWCPNVDPAKAMTSLSSLYPGDAYVDWTGLDGYNWGTNPSQPRGWQSFDQLYRATYNSIVGTIAPSKPLMIGEVASSEYGGSKAAWVKNMLSVLPKEYPKIRALLWFDKFDSGMDWPIETSTTATSAFAEGIQSSAYLQNTFLDLGTSSILPSG